MLNAIGQILYDEKRYNSPSPAGKDASGWKSCNGWKYWQYQDPGSKEWHLIDELRQRE
jgi:hypothetical protein